MPVLISQVLAIKQDTETNTSIMNWPAGSRFKFTKEGAEFQMLGAAEVCFPNLCSSPKWKLNHGGGWNQ